MSISTRLREDSANNRSSGERFWLGMCFVGISLILAASSYWGYSSDIAYLKELIEAERALVVYSEYSAAQLFLPIGFIACAAILFIHFLYRDALKRSLHKPAKMLQTGLYAVLFLGIALTLTGGFLVKPSWSSTFKSNGYTECNNFVLRFNKNFLNSAWVKNPQFCLDDQLHQILHDNHSRKGFEQAARYLERTYP